MLIEEGESEKKVRYSFLAVLIVCIAFLWFEIINAPLSTLHEQTYIQGQLALSHRDLLLSPYHQYIQIYRNLLTNILFRQFGVGEMTYRLAPMAMALAALVFVYRFVAREIGRREAAVVLLLYGISPFVLHSFYFPYYADIYLLASFLSFYFLWQGVQKEGWGNWIGLGIWNFINLTNVIIATLFLPSLTAVAVVLLAWEARQAGSFNADLRRKALRFVIVLGASGLLALTLYYFRGVNFFQMVYEMLLQNKTSPASLGSFTELYQSDDRWGLLKRFFYHGLVTFNFEYGDGSDDITGSALSHWAYFAIFIIGLILAYFRHRKLFYCVIASITAAFCAGIGILKIAEARYVSFILPLCLMVIAVGFVGVVEWLLSTVASPRNAAPVFLAAFLFFAWFVQSGFLFTRATIDSQYDTLGIRTISAYLREHIDPHDVILNATGEVELRAGYGDALVLYTFSRYLGDFAGKHALESLAMRSGKVGVWLILEKPLDKDQVVPFYFPGTYSPRVVKRVKSLLLYHGEVDIRDPESFDGDRVFNTPFWSFMKAHTLQLSGRYDLAARYYARFVNFGFNRDRGYYNLALLYLNSDISHAMTCLNAAIEEMETPTRVPPGAKMEKWSTYLIRAGGLPDKNNLVEGRYFFSEQFGVKTRKWLKEDIVSLSPSYYAPYYWTLGKVLFMQFTQNRVQEFFDRAVQLAQKTATINRLPVKFETSDMLAQYYSGPVQVLSLMGIHEDFPPLLKNAPPSASQADESTPSAKACLAL